MTTKTPTLATAAKNIIKQELKDLRKSRRVISIECIRTTKQLGSQIRTLTRSRDKSVAAWQRDDAQLARRIGILEGRL